MFIFCYIYGALQWPMIKNCGILLDVIPGMGEWAM
jgi:hypothetical protein